MPALCCYYINVALVQYSCWVRSNALHLVLYSCCIGIVFVWDAHVVGLVLVL